MAYKKFRWSKVYESPEEELIEFLQSRNLQNERITAEESTVRVEPAVEHATTIWCAEGSLVIHHQSTATSLQPGDALTVSPNTPYELQAGISGYVCYLTHNVS